MSKKYKCGSGWSEWFVPDFPIWLYFANLKKWACKPHDKDYEKGGTEADRLAYDIKFHGNIIKACMKSWFWKFKSYRYRADKTADMYFEAVRKYGGSKFNYKWESDPSIGSFQYNKTKKEINKNG